MILFGRDRYNHFFFFDIVMEESHIAVRSEKSEFYSGWITSNKIYFDNKQLIDRSKYFSQKMSLDFNHVTFNVNVNSLYDESMQKMSEVSRIQIEFVRKFENRLSSPQSHASMIFFLRNSLAKFQQVYSDLRSHFHDLNISFAFDLFRKMHLFMVTGYNFTAEAFSVALQDSRNQAVQAVDSRELKKAKAKSINKLGNAEFRKIEEMDFVINSLEAEEKKINEDISQMYKEALAHKSIVQKMKPSNAVRQITEVKDNVETIISRAESTFEQAYVHKYQEFKSYVNKLGKPQDVGKDFCESMALTIKNRFMEGMKLVAIQIREIHKEENVEIDTKEQQCQTEKVQLLPLKAKLGPKEDKRTIEKYTYEIDQLKKNQLSTSKDQADIARKCKTLQDDCEEAKKSYQALKQLFSEKSSELDCLKLDHSWVEHQKQRQVNKLLAELGAYRNRKNKIQVGSQVNLCISGAEVISRDSQTEGQYLMEDCENELIKVLKANNERVITRLAQRQTRIRELERQLRDSSNLKTEFTNVLKNVCKDLNLDNFSPSEEEPTLTQLIHRTSVLLDRLKADSLVKNLLFNIGIANGNFNSRSSQEEPCSTKSIIGIQKVQKDEKPAINRSGRQTRRNGTGQVLERMARGTRKLAFKDDRSEHETPKKAKDQQKPNANSKENVKANAACQTDMSYVPIDGTRLLETRCISIQTLMYEINPLKSETEIHAKRIGLTNNQSNNSQLEPNRASLAGRPKIKQNLASRRLDKSNPGKMTSSRNGVSGNRQNTTGNLTSRKETDGFEMTKQAKIKQLFQTIQIQENINEISFYKSSSKDFKLQQKEEKISHKQTIKKIHTEQMQIEGERRNQQKQNDVLYRLESNKKEDLNTSGCLSSLFHVERIKSSENPKIKQSPRNLLESVGQLRKKNRNGCKEVVFSLLGNSDHQKVSQAISKIMSTNQ